ncbi:MAG: MBL fold metallo-hydrolase [Chloroflexota bacterium]
MSESGMEAEGGERHGEMAPLLRELQNLSLGEGQVALVWLGQSGFAVRMGDVTFLLDPFLSPNPDRIVPPAFSVRNGRGIDALLCTHEHLDHFDAGAVRSIAASSPEAVVIVPRPIVPLVAGLGIDERRIAGAQPGQRIEVRGISVIPLPARHGVDVADAYTFGQELSAGLYRYLGYVVEAGDVRIYHAGDTILYEGMESALRDLHVDVALLPINGRSPERERQNLVGNLNAEEAATLAAAIGADVFVPMHYDMFAANLGHPHEAVDAVVRSHLDVSILVPSLKRPFVYTKPTRGTIA